MSNTNGLFATSDVAGSGNADSVYFIRKGDPVVIDDLVANNITCDSIDLNGGLLTTTTGGTILTLNGTPIAGGGIATITGVAPISVSAGVNPVVSLLTSGVVAGTYPLADVTVNNQGLITNINSGTVPPNDDWSSFPAQTAVNMNNFKITTLATPTVATDGANKGYVDGAITTAGLGFVNLLTNQTVGGIKTFTSIPVCATMPTNNDQLANKQYVDSAVSADALSNVLIAGNSAGANQINMNNNKIVNCLNPTDPQDVATKSYVDSAGSGTFLPLAGGTMASASATINMNGADLTNAGSVTAGGITETAQFGSAITPMFAFGAYATDISIGHYNPLTSMTLSSANDINITAVEDINLQSKDINLTQSDIASFMNLTATGGIVLGAGLGVNITGGTTIQINSAGNVSIGSGNVLGADTEIEKVAFKENEIYKVAGSADITIEDVASITNVGTAPNGAMLIQAEQNLTLNSTAGNVIVEGLTVNGTTITATSATQPITLTATGTGDIILNSADAITLNATGTGDINLNSQDQINIRAEAGTGFGDITLFADDAISATCKGAFTAGSTLGQTTLQGNNTVVQATATTTILATNGNVNIQASSTTGSDVNILTYDGVGAVVNRVDVNSATNGNITMTNNGTGWVQINSANAGSLAQLKLQNTASSSTPCQVEYFMNKTTAGANNDNIANTFFYGKDVAGNKVEYGRIQATIRDATTNSTNGSIQVRLADNMTTGGTTTEYWRWNGADGQNESFKSIDMNNDNDILNIRRIGLNATGGGFGTYGQAIISQAGGTNNLYSYTMPLTNNGTQGSISISAGTNSDITGNIPISLTSGKFITSPINKYEVAICGSFTGVNDAVELEIALYYGTSFYGGQTFTNGATNAFVVPNTTIGGTNYYTSYSIKDTVIVPSMTFPGTVFVYLFARPASGSHTIGNHSFNVTLTPVSI